MLLITDNALFRVALSLIMMAVFMDYDALLRFFHAVFCLIGLGLGRLIGRIIGIMSL